MASTPPCLPVSFCKQVMMDVPLRLAWCVSAPRWSAGSGSGCYCSLQVEVCILHSPRLFLWPCIFHGCVLYSLGGSVEDSSLFHFGAFFNLTWDFCFHHHPHLQSLCAPWHPPLLDVSVMTLCISSQTSHKLQKVSESHFRLFTVWHNFRNNKIQTVRNLPGDTVVANTASFLNTFIEFCHLENRWNYFELELK